MNAVTKHSFGPNAGKKAKGAGHPVMFGYPKPSLHFEPFSDGGEVSSPLCGMGLSRDGVNRWQASGRDKSATPMFRKHGNWCEG